MKTIFWSILCLFLLGMPAATAEPYVWPPYHYAVVMPARLVEVFDDTPEVYDGVEFPLFCGFASVYPKENKFVFTKVTHLPIMRVEELMSEIEKKGYVEFRTDYFFRVPVNDFEFWSSFLTWTNTRGVVVFPLDTDSHEVPLDMVPKFTRTCVYDSKKKPPVDCAYRSGDVEKLHIPYPKKTGTEKPIE